MRRQISRLALLAIFGAVAAGCAVAPPVPPGTRPVSKLILEQALIGQTRGEGVVTDITGGRTRFSVVIAGNWDGRVLTLAEDFTYEDGKKERKTWRLTKTSEGRYSGVREDVIGTANVYQDGDAVRLDYRVTLDTALGKLDCRFRDVLFMPGPGEIRNTATVSKLGLRLARVDLVMRPARP